YEALLKFSWLKPGIRRAVMAELGLSLRAQNKKIQHARAVTLQVLIAERKTVMRKNRERPRGGIHEAAVAHIARRQGMKVSTLKRHIQRHGDKGEERRKLQSFVEQRVKGKEFGHIFLSRLRRRHVLQTVSYVHTSLAIKPPRTQLHAEEEALVRFLGYDDLPAKGIK